MNFGISLDHTLIMNMFRKKKSNLCINVVSSEFHCLFFSDQTRITFKLLGIRASFSGTLTCLLVCPKWYLLCPQSSDLVNFQREFAVTILQQKTHGLSSGVYVDHHIVVHPLE